MNTFNMAHAAMHTRNDSGVSVNSVVAAYNPPSPTLTNPDMIMPIPPWETEPSFDEGPHPLLEPEIPLSHTLSNSSISTQRTSGVSTEEVGVATAILMPMRISVPPPTSIHGPSTPITTYTGYEHGAPLSDIYEESEATATPKSSRPRSPSPSPPSPPPEHERDSSATPTLRPTLRHKKRISTLSTSSSGGSDVGDWENFDSSKVLSSRVAADLAQLKREDTLDVDDPAIASRRQSREEEELATLNARAEKILENARKRLTHMEDNLKTARNSIVMPSRSPNIGAEHQPVGGLYRSISAAGATKLGKNRQNILPIRTTSSLQHMRGLSDVGVASASNRLSRLPDIRSASALEYGSPNRYSLFPDLNPTPAPRVQPSPASSRSYNSPLRPLEEEGNSTSTAETTPESVKAPPTKGLGILSATAASRDNLATTVDHPLSRQASTSAPAQAPTPTHMRSGSAASIRSTKELKDQMSDLKTRIADLKSKAQAESLKRRSWQSLRSSSPFTNAQPEQWYASSPAYQETSSPISANAGIGSKGSVPPTTTQTTMSARKQDGQSDLPITPASTRFLDVGRMTPDTEVKLLSSARTDRNTPLLARDGESAVETNDEQEEEELATPVRRRSREASDDIQDQDEDEDDENERIAENEEEQIYLNEVLEESLREADIEPEVPAIPGAYLNSPDGVPVYGPQPQRHEDRLDAFDYENMFLHSAMGTYTGKSINGSESGSDVDGSDVDSSGEGSVETSRAGARTPANDQDESSGKEDGEIEPETDEDIEDIVANGKSPGLSLQSTPQQPLGSPAHIDLSEPPKPWAHTRSKSAESVSSTATFETATEGNGNYDETPHEIYNWDPDPASSLGYSPISYQPYRANQNSPKRTRHGFSSPQGGGRSTPLAKGSPITNSPLRKQQHYEISYDREKALGSPGLGLGVIGGENAQFINDNGVPERFQGRPSPAHSRQGSASTLQQQKGRPESQATIVLASPAKRHLRQYSAARSPSTPVEVTTGSPVPVTVTNSPQRKVVVNRALQLPEPYMLEPQMAHPPDMPLPDPPTSHAALQTQVGSPTRINEKRPASAQKRTPPILQGQYIAPEQQAKLQTPPRLRGTAASPTFEPGPVPNTEILMESLIKLADPSFSLAPGMKFEEVDKNLVLSLLGAVGGVCNDILRASVQSGSPAMGKTQAEALVSRLRHRLDEATGMLDGRTPAPTGRAQTTQEN